MKPMSRNSYRRTSDLSLRTDYQIAKAAMEDKNSVVAFITCSHQLTELHHVEFSAHYLHILGYGFVHHSCIYLGRGYVSMAQHL